jgi:chemotaxis protein CheX
VSSKIRADFVDPFVRSAYEVLGKEANVEVTRGELGVARSAYLTRDVTILLGVTGSLRGIVFYGMSKATAIAIAERMIGEKRPEFDELSQSAIAELGNMITGRAATRLANSGFPSNLCPPGLILGKGSLFSTFDLPRLIVPFNTELGLFEVQVALAEH